VRAVIGSARYWVPLAAAAGCLIGASFAGPVVAWILLILAFGLLLDGATAMWERAGSTGNLTTHKQ
jgi:hypothetical protein